MLLTGKRLPSFCRSVPSIRHRVDLYLFRGNNPSSYAAFVLAPCYPKKCNLVGRSPLMVMLVPKPIEIGFIPPKKRVLYERHAIETVSSLCAW
jgi:hypothetical protein